MVPCGSGLCCQSFGETRSLIFMVEVTWVRIQQDFINKVTWWLSVITTGRDRAALSWPIGTMSMEYRENNLFKGYRKERNIAFLRAPAKSKLNLLLTLLSAVDLNVTVLSLWQVSIPNDSDRALPTLCPSTALSGALCSVTLPLYPGHILNPNISALMTDTIWSNPPSHGAINQKQDQYGQCKISLQYV